MLTYTSRTVEVYHNNLRIASHKRNRHAYGYTTDNNHRPNNHKFIADWTPERFIKWAQKTSPEVEQVISKIMDSRQHPEQAYRTCMGLLNLQKKYDKQDYIKACKKALTLDCLSYKFIKNVLDTKAFNLDTEQELELMQIPEHKNIRGKEHYN